MRKLVLLFIVISAIACKKKAPEAITKYSWVLIEGKINPAITIGGKTSTDYKALFGDQSCYGSNYTINFLENGLFTISSTGALCDMLPNNDNFKWTKDGDVVTLSYGGTNTETFKVSGDTRPVLDPIPLTEQVILLLWCSLQKSFKSHFF